MAKIRPVEERDAKGNTVRLNPAICFKQDRQIRVIVGRHDWRLDDNPDYHEPITAQVQNGKILFFVGVPDTTQTRDAAREISQKDVEKVAPYIIKELTLRPMKVREARPTVYEVRIATVGDVETTELTEMANDGESITVSPIAPDLAHRRLGGRPRTTTPAEAVA